MHRKQLPLIVTALILYNSLYAGDSTNTQINQNWVINTQGYFQVMYSSINESFDMPLARAFVKGMYTEQTSFSAELAATSGNPIIRLYMDYSLEDFLKFRVGQFSNPMKFGEPALEHKNFVYYALLPHYTPTFNDVGVAVLGKIGTLSYYTCIINGAGPNKSDNNAAKDFVGYLSFQPKRSFSLNLCWQAGKQPSGNRSGGFGHIIWSPLKKLNLQVLYFRREDLNENGWFLSGLYDFSQTLQFTARVHQLKQDSGLELTLGAQLFADRSIKFQPNIIIRDGAISEFVAIFQLFVK